MQPCMKPRPAWLSKNGRHFNEAVEIIIIIFVDFVCIVISIIILLSEKPTFLSDAPLLDRYSKLEALLDETMSGGYTFN